MMFIGSNLMMFSLMWMGAILLMAGVSERQKYLRDSRSASRFVKDAQMIEASPISREAKRRLRSRLFLKWKETRAVKREYLDYSLAEQQADEAVGESFEELIQIRVETWFWSKQSRHRYLSMQPFMTSLHLNWQIFFSLALLSFGLKMTDWGMVQATGVEMGIFLTATSLLLTVSHLSFLNSFPKATSRPLMVQDFLFQSEREMLQKTDSHYRSDGVGVDAFLKTPLLGISEATATFLESVIPVLREMQGEALTLEKNRLSHEPHPYRGAWSEDVCLLPKGGHVNSVESQEMVERRKGWLRKLVIAMDVYEEHFEEQYAVFFGLEHLTSESVEDVSFGTRPHMPDAGEEVRRTMFLKEEIQKVIEKGIADPTLSDLAQHTLAEAEQRYQTERTRQETFRAQWQKEDDMATLQAIKNHLRIP